MNQVQQDAVVAALRSAGVTPMKPLGGLPGTGSVLGAVSAAKRSLAEPEAAPNITPAGRMQIERKGDGDVQEMFVGAKREIKPRELDGTMTDAEFERLW
jgi:hypothetical protein